MSKQRELITLDIDVKKLETKIAATNRSITSLIDQQKLLKKSDIELAAEIERKVKVMAKAKNNGEENTAVYKKLENELLALTTINKLSANDRQKQLVKITAALKTKTAEERANMTILAAYTKQQKSGLQMIQQTNGSLNQITVALSNNKKLYASLSQAERQNAEIGGKLLKVINAQDKEYKQLHKSMKSTQTDVGSYKEEMRKVINTSFNLQSATTAILGPFGSLSPLVTVTTKSLKKFVTGQKTATKTTSATSKSLKGFRLALLATGIGAIVVLIGALVAAFASTQAGTDKVSRALAPLKTIFQSLIGVFQKVSIAMVSAFKNPQKAINTLWEIIKSQIVNRITGIADTFLFLGKTIKSALTLDFDGAKENAKKLGESVTQTITGVDEFSKKVGKAAKNTADFFSEAAKKGREIADLKIKIEETENNLIAKNAELSAQYEKQKEIAQDINKSSEERRAAAQSAIAIQNEILDGEKGLLDMKINLKRKEFSLNDTDREQKRELQELIAQQSEQEASAARKRASARNLEKTIDREAVAAANKRVEAELQASKMQLDLYIAQNKTKAQSLQGSLDYEQTVHDKKVQLLKDELSAKKKTQEEFDLEMLNLGQELAQTKAELTTQHAQKELEIYIAQNQSKIGEAETLTQELITQEENRLYAIYEKKKAIIEQQRADDLISEQDFTLAKLEINADYLQQTKDLHNQLSAQQTEAKKLNQANENELEKVNADNKYEQQLLDLDRKCQAEIAAANKVGADTTLIEEKYAKQRSKINKQEMQSKFMLAGDIMGKMSSLLGKESAAGKIAAIAQATINTYLGVSKAIAQGGLWGIAQGAIVGAAGIAQVMKIQNTSVPKAEHGAVFSIGGKPHSAGGTKFYGEDGTTFEAEQDEMLVVINKAASRALGGLSRLNQQYGGKALTSHTNYLAAGGTVSRPYMHTSSTLQMDYKKIGMVIAEQMTESIKQLPPPVTRVQDIIAETDSYNAIINQASY